MGNEPTISLVAVTGHLSLMCGQLHALMDEFAALSEKCHAALDAVPVPEPSPLLTATAPDACNCGHAGLPEGFHAKNCPARVPVPEPSTCKHNFDDPIDPFRCVKCGVVPEPSEGEA